MLEYFVISCFSVSMLIFGLNFWDCWMLIREKR